MKKNILLITILIISIFSLPNRVLAKENDIYMFYGNTCIFCESAKEYFKTLFKDYPNLKIYMYEVWEDTPNQKLFKKVSKEIGYKDSAVPLIIIGDKYYSGYVEEDNSILIEALNNESKSLMKEEYIKDGNYTLITKDESKLFLNKYYINKKLALSIGISIVIGAIIIIPIIIYIKKSRGK